MLRIIHTYYEFPEAVGDYGQSRGIKSCLQASTYSKGCDGKTEKDCEKTSAYPWLKQKDAYGLKIQLFLVGRRRECSIHALLSSKSRIVSTKPYRPQNDENQCSYEYVD